MIDGGRGIVPSGQPQVADALVAYLEQLGIEFIFGVPGGAVEPLYNAIARSSRRGGIRHILARHEAGAAFMADGYARETGKVGVCCATSGPGATNLITGVACAYENDIPLLVITGQPALPDFGKNPLQESSCTGINTLGMFLHCTRFNSLVSHPKQFESKMVSALQRAVRSPRGPSHLTFPLDVLRSPHPPPAYDLQSMLASSALVDEEAIEKLNELLCSEERVVLLIGGWCVEAIGSIMRFVELAGISFVTTPDGKGLVNPSHPLYRGVFGFGGHESAKVALGETSARMILAAGVSMGEWNSGGWSECLLNERLVHIDESEDHLSRTPMARLHVRGRIQSVFSRLIEIEERKGVGHRVQWDARPVLLDEPEKCESDATPIKPQRLMRELGRLFPPATRFLADIGNSVSWAIHYLHLAIDRGDSPSAGRWLQVTMNFAPMGWAIGGAVGTAIANPDAPVVCITGDGSLLMNGQELSVAVAEKLTVVFLVLNDRALGMVKHGQRLSGAEQIGCELPGTDFAMLARSMGAVAHTIRSPEDLAGLDIDVICGRKGPTLLDVLIDPEEVPPMNVRMRVLANFHKE